LTTGAWIELQVELAAPAAELVAAELSELLGGVEVRDAETVFATAPDRAAVVALCRPDQIDDVLGTVEAVLATARAAGGEVDPVTVRQRPAHEDEWRDVWKQFFRTTPIGRRFVVQPSWDEAAVPTATHVIHLDPGRAFGTGAHPSTKLVIAAIERLRDARPRLDRFLDLGCGSGILTIAARLLWPEARALAVDLDPEAVACTRENLERNRIAGVQLIEGTLDDVRALPGAVPFDLLMANIQRDVLETLAPALPAHLAPGGRLVLSGLLTSDLAPVQRRFEQVGLRLREGGEAPGDRPGGDMIDGEWGGLVFELPPPG
jgi:ribosomal protein L11 methyltransferase